MSTNEREFVAGVLAEGRRLDGRGFYDYRTLKLTFPHHQPGHCQVQLGQTRQVPQDLFFLIFRRFLGVVDDLRVCLQGVRGGALRGGGAVPGPADGGLLCLQHGVLADGLARLRSGSAVRPSEEWTVRTSLELALTQPHNHN